MTGTSDDEPRRLHAVVVDTDRRESPFGWSELPPPPRVTRDQIDNALRWDNLRRRAASGDVLALVQLAAHNIGWEPR